jgi:DNA-binding LacI/PurR family transcriptional regulator
MNDRVGFQYLWWADAAGIEVPRHLSIVAFDNVGESEALPLTTVDFGFARLGYLAAHVLIGDIPVRADEAGNIPGTCTLIDRGSVGRPGPAGDVERMPK